MHTAALIAALFLGAIGACAYLGITMDRRHIRRRKAIYVAIIVAAVAGAAISGGLFGVTLLGAAIALMVVLFDTSTTVGKLVARRGTRRS
jgi:Sec-independent protein secretion pathway component TatC